MKDVTVSRKSFQVQEAHNFYYINYYLLFLQNSLSIYLMDTLSHSFGVIHCLELEILGNLECNWAFSISLNSFIVQILPARKLVTQISMLKCNCTAPREGNHVRIKYQSHTEEEFSFHHPCHIVLFSKDHEMVA